MSGFAGVISVDGQPAGHALVERMAAALAFRGPDGQRVWVDGAAGLAYARHRTTREAAHDEQPWSANGTSWIVGDIRLDARADLVAALAPRCDCTRTDLLGRPDAELALLAYDAWGDACVERLAGDFAFAVWDAGRRRLFGARDQFGVRQFVYGRTRAGLVFSNTLDVVRLHPEVSDRLDEAFMADFLLFGRSYDVSASAFADIRRLPAAHVLIADTRGVEIKRYWTFPVDDRVRYRRSEEYVEHFRDVFDAAVSDRLRFDRVAVLMSGGVDSTAIAASATRVSASGDACAIKAFTAVFDRLIPDEERRFSTLAADALGIPIEHVPQDDCEFFPNWDRPCPRTPEPLHLPFGMAGGDGSLRFWTHSPIALAGHGGDPLFAYMTNVVDLAREGHFGQIGSDIFRSVLLYRRLPPVGIRTTLRRLLGISPAPRRAPAWMNPDLIARLRLADRVAARPKPEIDRRHPVHGSAQASLLDPTWPAAFRFHDAANAGVACETRYPFFDLRVVRYVLAIPPVPWLPYKKLLRMMNDGLLPESVTRRPKAPLAADPCAVAFRGAAARHRLGGLVPAGLRCPFLAPGAFSGTFEPSTDLWLDLRPFSLVYWLRWSGTAEGRDVAVALGKARDVTRVGDAILSSEPQSSIA